jgi:hypothetical protein
MMFLNEVLERGQRVRLLSGEKGIIIGKNENFEFPLWEIKLENGKILTEGSVPGKSLQTGRTSQQEKRLTTCITKMEISYFLHENGI